MTAANLWIEPEAPPSPRWGRLALALLLGALLGAALTALASDGRPAAPEAPAAEVRVWEPPALDRAWRGYRTPVDVDRMFPRRGRTAGSG